MRISARTILVLVVVAAWFQFLRPEYLGGPAGYVQVVGTSMEPTLHTGDVVFTQRKSSYAIGDIVAYRVPRGQPGAGHVVIHRITGGSAKAGYVLRGDNRDAVDYWKPRASDVIGVQRARIPAAATWGRRLLTPVGLGLLAGLATIILLWPGADARTPPRSRAARRSPGASPGGSGSPAAGPGR